LKPNLYRLTRRVALGDRLQTGGEVFLNAAMALPSWAWCRGGAEGLLPRRAQRRVILFF